MKPGIYPNIPNEEYHGGPGLSSTALKLLLERPDKYHWQYVLGNPRPSRKIFDVGSTAHTLILEGDKFYDEHIIVDSPTRSHKPYKDAVKEHADSGKMIMTELELQACCGIADAVLNHRIAGNLLAGARCEESIYWQEGDLLCKCRPDAWRPDISVCGDLKTTGDASPDFFERNSFKLGYHISAAWYLRGIEAATGERMDQWAWIVVETEAPHAVQVYEADPDLLERGMRQCDLAIETLKRCQDEGHWPAYSDNIISIGLPRWAA